MGVRYRIGCTALLCIAASCVAGAYDSAEGIRCGGNLITVGDSVEQLVESCGEPLRREGNLWFYQESEGSFLKAVGVGNGEVLFIRVEQE